MLFDNLFGGLGLGATLTNPGNNDGFKCERIDYFEDNSGFKAEGTYEDGSKWTYTYSSKDFRPANTSCVSDDFKDAPEDGCCKERCCHEEEQAKEPEKIFGIYARIDEPRREDYDSLEEFLADHEKYDRATDAIEACTWKNKSDDAPLHKVMCEKVEGPWVPPTQPECVVGESHFDEPDEQNRVFEYELDFGDIVDSDSLDRLSEDDATLLFEALKKNADSLLEIFGCKQ
jgi:hypothetical protein